jgi:hypothetical protein
VPSLVLASLALAGCGHPERRYESVCQVTRMNVVETGDKDVTQQLDLELEWDPCPGDQVQIVRGGEEFAACIAKKGTKPGDMVPVKVLHFWDTRGFFRWDIDEVDGCARPIQPDVEGSYEKSQECQETKGHGRVDGFACNRRPFKRLVSICPWMARD